MHEINKYKKNIENKRKNTHANDLGSSFGSNDRVLGPCTARPCWRVHRGPYGNPIRIGFLRGKPNSNSNSKSFGKLNAFAVAPAEEHDLKYEKKNLISIVLLVLIYTLLD